jgi:hypothetical protein
MFFVSQSLIQQPTLGFRQRQRCDFLGNLLIHMLYYQILMERPQKYPL